MSRKENILLLHFEFETFCSGTMMQALRRVCLVNRTFNAVKKTGSAAMGRRLHSTEQKETSNGGSVSEIDTLKKDLIEREGQLKELKDSYLLSLADMENLRQRTKRDIEAASQFAIQRFCKDIVSVADVLEMALGSTKPDTSVPAEKRLDDLISGLSMTMDELHRVFGRHGLSIINPLNQKFDPNSHNALYEVPKEDVDAGTVVAVQKKGYMLNHRVIRPADVGVSKKP